MSEENCICGQPATDHIIVTNKDDVTIKLGFCEAHKEQAQEAVRMLQRNGMNEL